MDKSSLLASIQTQRKNLETTLAPLSRVQMIVPGVIGDWSVKDTLAHISAWEGRLTRWLTASLLGKQPDLPPPYGMDDEALDRLNQQIYLKNCDKPLTRVRTEYHSSFQETLSAIAAVPEKALLEPKHFDLPEGIPLWEMAAANTGWHYAEHNQDFQTWLATENSGDIPS